MQRSAVERQFSQIPASFFLPFKVQIYESFVAGIIRLHFGRYFFLAQLQGKVKLTWTNTKKQKFLKISAINNIKFFATFAQA